ncbi:hypothetical protein Efla_002350 [Eimeria flavescens]
MDLHFSAPPGVFAFLNAKGSASFPLLEDADSGVHAALVQGAPPRGLSASYPAPSTSSGPIPIAPSLAFFSFLFFFAIFLQWLISKIPVYPPPVSIIWFVFGMAAYGVASAPALLPEQPWDKPGAAGSTPGKYQAPLVGCNILQTAILEMRFIDSSVVYYVMTPILLYEATQNINWHKFKKFLAGGLTLAVLGVALQVGILGVLFYYTCIGRLTQWADHAWTAAFLLAATLSSTDPVAVLSVLNAVNASDKICTMFDGESLINDGSAVLLFQFFFFLLQGVAETPVSTFIMFVKLLFLGPAFGVAVGLLAYAWLLFFRKHPLMQCLAYIAFCYISYFLAEAAFSLSGPLTAVCYGLFIKAYGRIALDRDAQTKHYTFVGALALMANCTIFIVSGIVTYGMMSSVFTRADGVVYWLHLLLTYAYLNAARIIMIVLFLPILRRTGYGLTWKEAVLLVWGGLRGGIVLALGLRIERDGDLDADLTNTLSFLISGSVFLILLVNGMTFEILYRLLNPYPPKPFRRVYLEAVMRMIDHQYLEDRKALENHWLFKGTDVLTHADRVVPRLGWRKVDRLGNLDIRCPDITQAFMSLHEAAIYSWVVPTDQLEEEEQKEEEKPAEEEGRDRRTEHRGSVSPRAAEDRNQPRAVSSSSSPYAAAPESAAAEAAAAARGCLAPPASAHASSTSSLAAAAAATRLPSSCAPSAAKPAAAAGSGAAAAATAAAADKGQEGGGQHAELLLVIPSGISSATDNQGWSPDAAVARDVRRRAAEAEQQERQAHSLAARGQGLKQSGTRGFDPKFNLRLIEHATTEAAEHEMNAHLAEPSDKGSQSDSDGGESVDVLEVTLQGEDPTTHAPLYRLTCRGSGVGAGGAAGAAAAQAADQPLADRRKERRKLDRALGSLKKVVMSRYVDSSPLVRHWHAQQSDFKRSRTIGSGSVRVGEEGSRRLGSPSPLAKSRTGLGLCGPCRADEGQQTAAANAALPNEEAPLFSAAHSAAAAAAAVRDTRARRFDTDATIVFNDVCVGAWEEPRKHRRGLFRLLSGRQQSGMRGRPLVVAFEANHNNGVSSASSRRSSALSHAGNYQEEGQPERAAAATKEQTPSPTPPPPAAAAAGQTGHRRVCLAPLPSIGRRRSSSASAGGRPQQRNKQEAAAAAAVNGTGEEEQRTDRNTQQEMSAANENGIKTRRSFSLASSESYFELPMSPRPHEGGDMSSSRRKVLRKEREGELYLMIFNACREMYHRLYHKQCIGGSALLSLNTSLDLSNDFAVGKNLTGFEYEWSVLQSRLHCLQYQRSAFCCFWRNLPSAFLRSLVNSGACQSDLEQLLAFVDVHEELLDKGGRNMELLMGRGLLSNYKQQILSAKRFVLYIRDCYPDSFRFAVCKVAATLLLNLKIKLVKDTASKGLVLEEDKEKLLQILDEQQFRLSRFRPCLILIRPQACLPAPGAHLSGFGGSTPRSASRPHSPMAFSSEHEVEV